MTAEIPFCERCGEKRTMIYAASVLNESGGFELMALCGDCIDTLRECPDCGQYFSGRGKYCLECRTNKGEA